MKKEHPETAAVRERAKKGLQWRQGHQSGYSEASKAYGGCTKCYGKGYATQLHGITTHADFEGDVTFTETGFPYRPCSCDRGRQIERMLTIAEEHFQKRMRQELSDFADENYPKGKSKERGAVVTHVAEYLAYAQRKVR